MKVLKQFRFALAFLCLLGLLIAFISSNSIFAAFSSNFTPNQELALPLTAGSLPVVFIVRGLEPSLRVDVQGTIYVSSIRGVPGGIDMHRWSPFIDPLPNADGTLPFKYLGQPDNCGVLAGGCAAIGIAEGGGDTDIATGFPSSGIPNLAVTSQTVVPGETSLNSLDRGETFSDPNVLSNPIVGEDREWMDAIDAQTVYMAVHDAATFNINVFRSTNGGQSYFDGYGQGVDPQTFPAAGAVGPQSTANVAGSLRVDTTQCTSRGNLYTIFVAPDNAIENASAQPFRSVYVGVSTDAKLNLPVYTFTDHKIFTGAVGSSAENLFPALDLDDSGNVYAIWSDNTNILLSYSTDQATTWSTPQRVNQSSTVGKANVFPWIAADANGHVVVVWYGADRAGNSNDTAIHEPCPIGTETTCMSGWTKWNVYFAETVNGHNSPVSFIQSQISDHVMHRGTISTGGLTGNANRDLADYFQVALDPARRANVAFSDDHKLHPMVIAGHEGNDDPEARRLIRVNFTRQIKATAGIVKKGVCTIDQPEQGNKITGGGRLGQPVSFGLIAKDTPLNGALQYQDTAAALKVHSSNGIDSVAFSGSCATFTGKAKVNQNPGYDFRINACDLAEPGAGTDFLSIDVTGPNLNYHKEGSITSGNIQMHSN